MILSRNKEPKTKYIIWTHDESDVVGIMTEQQWDNDPNNCIELNYWDWAYDIEFAEFVAGQLACIRGYELTPYQETIVNEPFDWDVKEVNLEDLLNLEDKLDNKNYMAVQFDLKFCGRAYVDKDYQRIDPIKVQVLTNRDIKEVKYVVKN